MRRLPIVVPVLGLTLLLAACGGGTTSLSGTTAPDGPSTTGPSSQGPATDPPPSIAASAPAAGGFTGPVTAAATPQDLLALLPAELCGKQPARYAFTGEEWLQQADPGARDTLAAAGKTPDDVIVAIEITQGGSVCNATIVRMKGLTPEQVLAVNERVGGVPGAKPETVDGLDLWHKDGEMLKTYYYVIGDVLLTASALDDAAARQVLAVLPKP